MRFLWGVVTTLVVLVVAFGIGLLIVTQGYFPLSADVRAGSFEEWLGNTSRNAWVSRHAPKEKNPLPVADQVLVEGGTKYSEHCSLCHGGTDHRPGPLQQGAYPTAPELLRKPPNAPDADLFYAIKHGVRFTAMPAWERVLSDDQIWAIVRFIKSSGHLSPQVQQELQ